MVDKKVLACFFTGGYTEAYGYMQIFLGKINDKFVYEQCMPNSTRKRKGVSKSIADEYNGITGTSLLSKIYGYLKKPYIRKKFDDGIYTGVLIEDDLDGRFDELNDKKKIKDIKTYESNIKKEIWSILGRKYPVYFIYASPEIESWFVADWGNGFGYYFINDAKYKEVDPAIRNRFSIILKKRIIEELLENKVDEIEKYAYAKGKYRKLSEDINAVIGKLNTEFSKYNSNKLTIDKKMCFSYSKKEHGYMLLKVLEPIKVKEVCTEYFGECYIKLCNGIIE